LLWKEAPARSLQQNQSPTRMQSAIKNAFGGRVIVPTDAEYDFARLAYWNCFLVFNTWPFTIA